MKIRFLSILKPIIAPSMLGILYLPIPAMMLISAICWMILLYNLFSTAKDVLLLDQMFMPSIEDVRNNLLSYSSESFRYHRLMLLPDTILPLGLGYFLFMAITFLSVSQEHARIGKVNKWSYMAFVAMLTDYAENALIFQLLSFEGKVPEIPDHLISSYIVANFFKFVSIALTLIVFIQLLAKWAQKLKRRNKRR